MHMESMLRSRTPATMGALALIVFTMSAHADDGLVAGPLSSEAPAESGPHFPAPEGTAPRIGEPPPTPVASESIYLIDDDDRPALPYRDGTHVPKGFRLDTSPRFGFVAAGAITSGALWGVSTIAAIALDKQQSVDGDPNFDDRYWPMFIPVVGPFVSIATANASGTGAGILALDGAFQAGGLAMMIAGLAAPKLELIPQKGVYVGAGAGPGDLGLSLRGSF